MKLLLPIFLSLSFAATAQMTIERESLFGNEWIDYSKTYFRLPISADGVYRLSTATLTAAGVPVSVAGSRFQIFVMGKEVPIYTSTDGTLGGADFIEFYGRRNRSGLDSLMYRDAATSMLNPEMSVYNDTIHYYLTWNTIGTNKRYGTQANNLTNLPTPDAWFWNTEKYIGAEQATKPEIGSTVYLPEFGKGEGLGSYYAATKSITFSARTPFAGQPAQAKIRWTGETGPHQTLIKINANDALRDTTYDFGVRERTINIAPSQVVSNMVINLKGEADATDYNSIGVASLKYASAFDFGNKKTFEFPIAASDVVKYLEIDNFNANGVAPILYDLTNNFRMTTTLDGSKVKAALPPSVSERNLVLVAASTGTSTPLVITQPFVDLRTDGGDYIFISSSRHLNDPSNNVKLYADYRATAAGGSFRTKVIDVEQLYHQFGYGVARHPLSIRNFLHYAKRNWANPRYVLLVGKAREYRIGGAKTDMENIKNRNFDVPTWGYPGSDVLLAADNASDEPRIPIGRVAITSTFELKTYLDKVKEYENIAQTASQTLDKREWFKNVMHLSGGGSNEYQEILNNMNAFKNIIENSKFGAKVTTFSKSNLDPVQVTQNDQIFDRLNKGISMVSFYGHSSAALLDFDINIPSNMKNKGKYPVFMALGCSAANMHQDFTSIGESFTLYQDKGTSAFIGTTGTSFLSSLNVFATEFYKNISDKLYGETLGNILKKTINTYALSSGGLKSVVQEFTINGDPALRFNAGAGPDYLVDEKTVQFEPSVLTAQLDSFNVKVDMVNIGTAVTDSMNILFRQQLPNGLIYDLKLMRVKTPQYRTTLNVRLPMPTKVVVTGQNRLHIRLDVDNQIAELPTAGAESNNEIRSSTGELGIPFYILENNAKPVYPAEFAIVGKTPVVLKASTSDALAKSQNYLMEIDTTENFNSSFKQRTVINQKGGVLKWTPNVAWRDSAVYYWRVSIDSTSPQVTYAWQARSFTYIRDQEGWGQSHYFQFLKNDYTTLVLNKDDRKFAYITDLKTVELRYPYPTGISPTFIPLFLVNNVNYTGRNWGYPNAGMYITVFDEPTGNPWWQDEPGVPRFSLWPPRGTYNSFPFNTDVPTAETGRKGILDFLAFIPQKSIVQIFTVQQSETADYRPDLWAADSIAFGTNIFKALEKEGATRVRELQTTGSKPYSFVYQKGVGPIAENRGATFLDGAPLNYVMTNRWNRGNMSTKAIGPVASWKTLELNFTANLTPGSGDTLGFDVIGMTDPEKGVETVLIGNVRANSTSLAGIDVRQYPYLKLRFNSKDTIQRTSPQLLAWRILYKGLPDLAVNPNLAYSISKDSVAQGEKIDVSLAVENVSEIDADSVTVQWIMRDQYNNENLVSKKFAPLSKNANFNVPITLDTKNWLGRYNFEFTVNPRMTQPELYSFNNYLQKPILITKDKKKPLLSVFFDGVRAVPLVIVSPKPTILVNLVDDNPYLKLTDTSVLSLTLQFPNGQKKIIAFDDPTVRFIPASAANQNKASVEFKPILTQDGTYQLTVKGKDMSNNAAGDVDYSISFQVIMKSSISNVLNYPNPFSTRTQFVYTLTGESPPPYFRIQIMTISGKVVREITQDELGPLKIGTHKTEYAWDGHDEYGNQLANGVYLYRIIAKNKDGKAFDAFEGDTTNDMFKKGIGKLVILR